MAIVLLVRNGIIMRRMVRWTDWIAFVRGFRFGATQRHRNASGIVVVRR